MSPDRKRIDPEILHDYVDNQLDDETRLEVARHIGENPVDAALVRAYRDQNEALQRLFGPAAAEPVPQHLLDMVEKACLESARQRQETVPLRVRSRRRGAWAAALVALCLGGIAGWWGQGVREAGLSRQAALNAFIDQAVQSYTLYAGSAGQLVDAPIDDVQKFTDWFRQQLDVRVLAPQLGAGFKLVSARILPAAFGTAGQLVYAEPGGSVSPFTCRLPLQRAAFRRWPWPRCSEVAWLLPVTVSSPSTTGRWTTWRMLWSLPWTRMPWAQ